uniref:Protein RIC1 homolog n=1 Tax=Ditylenchus dipsaci TaxID=166011 RepID=A0A915E3L8_9BILA
MYLPDGCDVNFVLPNPKEKVRFIVASRERSIIAVVTDSALYFYLASLQLLLCTYRRTEKELKEQGAYRKLYWRHNSSSICVITSSNYVYIYTMEISLESDCFNLKDSSEVAFNRQSEEFHLRQKRPSINIFLAVQAKLDSEATCVVSLLDELFICLMDGWIHRLSWVGNFTQELSFIIRNVPFAVDQITGKSESFPTSSMFVQDMVYCPLIGGLCAVLSDGRAGLIVSSTPQFRPESVSAVWALGLNDACCCAANHKFRLVYFGCRNGEIAGYSMDDTIGSLIQVFRLGLFIKNGTEYLDKILNVRQIQCLSQGTVFSVIWNVKKQKPEYVDKNDSTSTESSSIFNLSGLSLTNGTAAKEEPEIDLAKCPPAIAIFSTFGAQWWSSFEYSAAENLPCIPYSCMDWGPEGFQLWLGTRSRGLTMMNLVRSVPEILERVIMVGSDRVCLSPMRSHEKNATAPHFIWQTYKVPFKYITTNWPLRYVRIDTECNRVLVVAGTRGFCYCMLKNMKWKIFNTEAQEKALSLNGGLAVFQDFIIVAATHEETDHIYAFSINEQLKLESATSVPTNRILLMSSRQDHLITFDINSTVVIYSLKQKYDMLNKKASLEMECLAEIRITELLFHLSCVVSIQLTQLNYYPDVAEFCPGMDSLLLNVSGHLLLLSPLHNKPANTNGTKASGKEPDDITNFQLHPPTLIASSVERVWIHSTNRQIPHLNKALWINAGCKRMIWLPLSQQPFLPTDETKDNRRTFISRRIMLPIELSLYPLAIDEDCLACGAECFANTLESQENIAPIAVHSLNRTSEVFLHKLLKQLLKRNLGSYALAIVSACRPLPYFSHILELLLHDVLDEEATSSEPIPDPLLPTIVSFIREFPEYLQTIVHCARKTELAFWNILFSASHHPREIFKMCMDEDQLDTATSCLILLQSVEPVTASTQYASLLLEEALNKRRWTLARDIVRFMQSISTTDYENTPESPVYQKLIARGNKQMCILPNDSATAEQYGLVFNGTDSHKSSITNKSSTHKTPVVTRQSSGSTSAHSPTNLVSLSTPTTSFSTAKSSSNPPPLAMTVKMPSIDAVANGAVCILKQLQNILIQHAEALLEYYALRDLGAFSSHLDFDLVQFFSEHPFGVPADEFP